MTPEEAAANLRMIAQEIIGGDIDSALVIYVTKETDTGQMWWTRNHRAKDLVNLLGSVSVAQAQLIQEHDESTDTIPQGKLKPV